MTVSMRGLINCGFCVLALMILLGGELFLRREMLLLLEDSSLDEATLEMLHGLSATHELWLIVLVGILALLSVLIFWNTGSASIRHLKKMVLHNFVKLLSKSQKILLSFLTILCNKQPVENWLLM